MAGHGTGDEAVRALAEQLYVELVARTLKTTKIEEMNPSAQVLLKLSYALAMEFHSGFGKVEADAVPVKQKFEFQISDLGKS